MKTPLDPKRADPEADKTGPRAAPGPSLVSPPSQEAVEAAVERLVDAILPDARPGRRGPTSARRPRRR